LPGLLRQFLNRTWWRSLAVVQSKPALGMNELRKEPLHPSFPGIVGYFLSGPFVVFLAGGAF